MGVGQGDAGRPFGRADHGDRRVLARRVSRGISDRPRRWRDDRLRGAMVGDGRRGVAPGARADRYRSRGRLRTIDLDVRRRDWSADLYDDRWAASASTVTRVIGLRGERDFVPSYDPITLKPFHPSYSQPTRRKMLTSTVAITTISPSANG